MDIQVVHSGSNYPNPHAIYGMYVINGLNYTDFINSSRGRLLTLTVYAQYATCPAAAKNGA